MIYNTHWVASISQSLFSSIWGKTKKEEEKYRGSIKKNNTGGIDLIYWSQFIKLEKRSMTGVIVFIIKHHDCEMY